MRITVLLIFFISHLIFIPSVFGEGFILSCPKNISGQKPMKFKFSEDKKSSWFLLNDRWVELKTKQTESYYYLNGLHYPKKCEGSDIERDKGVGDEQPRYIDFEVPILYSIDRSTMKLYETVFVDMETPDVCKTKRRWKKGETLNRFGGYCTVAKIKF